MENDWLYRLALTRVRGIGSFHMRTLTGHFGEARAVFRASTADLEMIRGIGKARAKAIVEFTDFHAAEKEQAFLEKYKIRPLFFTDKDYPRRLVKYNNAPALLFYKGNADLNAPRVISVVGTRCPTEQGKQAIEIFIRELKLPGLLVISGLAYGIDAAAHKAALRSHLPTVAVLGHGLRQIYPEQHRGLAGELVRQGGLLTQFSSDAGPEEHHFPVRNRVVAGMSDALVVVETACLGGSMLTVENAITYQKKVFAFPGRVDDRASAGCNTLIRDGKARLLTGPAQFLEEMQWGRQGAGHDVAQPMANGTGPGGMTAEEAGAAGTMAEGTSLSLEEKSLLQYLREKGSLSLDELLVKYHRSSSMVAGLLLSLELQGLISALPGKIYRVKQ